MSHKNKENSDSELYDKNDSEKQKEKNRRQKKILGHQLKLNHINPLTNNQQIAFAEYFQGQHLLLHGMAGTGKTFIALYLGLNDLLKGVYEKIIVIRSAVSTRDVGFLPGNLTEKMSCYEGPYQDMCGKLFEKPDAYNTLKSKSYIEFISSSFLRGLTFDNSLIIIDEFQNMNYHELFSIFTRVGNNSRLLLCGDINQTDLEHLYKKDKSGAYEIMEICDRMSCFASIEFEISDIVRSGFAKDFLLAAMNV